MNTVNCQLYHVLPLQHWSVFLRGLINSSHILVHVTLYNCRLRICLGTSFLSSSVVHLLHIKTMAIISLLLVIPNLPVLIYILDSLRVDILYITWKHKELNSMKTIFRMKFRKTNIMDRCFSQHLDLASWQLKNIECMDVFWGLAKLKVIMRNISNECYSCSNFIIF